MPLAVCAGEAHRTCWKSMSVAGTRRQPKAHCSPAVGAKLKPVTTTLVPPTAGPALGLASETTASW